MKFKDIQQSKVSGKGQKNRKAAKKSREPERLLEFKEDLEEYAHVTRMLGNCRLEAMCFDGVKRICQIRGTLRNRVWIYEGDIILVGLRGYQDAKADVLWKYFPEEVSKLQLYGELPESFKFKENSKFIQEGFDEFVEFIDDAPDISSTSGISSEREGEKVALCSLYVQIALSLVIVESDDSPE